MTPKPPRPPNAGNFCCSGICSWGGKVRTGRWGLSPVLRMCSTSALPFCTELFTTRSMNSAQGV